MPGGTNYRQWYAMRKRLQEAGKWHGRPPTHSVPLQEEGEPSSKTPTPEEHWASETSSGGSVIQPTQGDPVPESQVSTPESLPDLESPPTTEGNGRSCRFLCPALDKT